MGYTLLDRPNPNGPHYYTTRNQPVLAIVVHITAGAEDLDTLADLSAENVAAYAGSTDREVSWHTGSDTDSWVDLLPSTYTAWHASNYNSCTHGHEISKRHTDWRVMSADWTAKTLRMAAVGPNGDGGLRAIALKHGVPFRKATRAELDEQRANYAAGRPWKPVGFIGHTEVQPADRTDPGLVGGVDTFPWARFMALLTKEDDVSAADVWTTPVPSHITPSYAPQARVWLTTNAAKLENLQAMMSALIAAQDGLDEAAILAQVDASVRAATTETLKSVVVPALREVVRDVLGEDNIEQAEAIVDQLGERLRPVA